MKKMLFLITTLALVSISTFAAKSKRMPAHIPGEIIIKLKAEQKSQFMSLKNLQGKVLNEMSLLNGQYILFKKSNKQTLEQTLKELNDNPSVEYAEPNFVYKAIQNDLTIQDVHKSQYSKSKKRLTNDPKFGELWGLINDGTNEPTANGGNSSATGRAGSDINAAKAWKITKGNSRIKIAVIDTGVDYNHEDLKSNMWTNEKELNGKPGIDDDGNGYVDDIHGYDFANNDGDPMDGNGHGTHCSGTIAAGHNNGIGIAGVMANAQIVGVKFLTDEGSGTTAAAIAAIDYATKVGVDIMSNSWGGGGHSQALEDVIKVANAAGIIFTAAAGNSASNNNSTPQYPANYDVSNVISVAAHNYNDDLASFSCYGSNTVHVAAPGRNILSTTPNNNYDVFSGTSMATPHVTGVIGLYLSEHGKQDPETLRENLMRSSVYAAAYGRTTISGGRVDAYNFLSGIVTSRPIKPDPNAWISKSVSLFESKHPYENSSSFSKTYRVSGAKFVRAIVRKFNIEENYDGIVIMDKNGSSVQRVDGKGSNKATEYVDGDTIKIKFESDTSVNEWGFAIEEIQYIK